MLKSTVASKRATHQPFCSSNSPITLIVLVLLFIQSFCLSASPLPNNQDYLASLWSPYFEKFSVDEGMSQSMASVILQDKDEFIWLLTPVGVDRFNGYEFENMKFYSQQDTNPHLKLVSLLLDHDNNMTAITNQGSIYTFSAKHHQFINTFTPQKPLKITQAVMLPEKKLLLIGEEKLHQLQFSKNHIELTQIDPPEIIQTNQINHAILDQQSILWIGTKQGQLFSYDVKNRHFHQYKIPRKKRNNRDDNLQLTPNNNGGIFFAFRSGELFEAKHLQTKTLQLLINQKIANKIAGITALLQSPNEDLWVATQGQGIYRMQLKSKSIQQYKLQNSLKGSLSSNNIYALFLDKQGQLWASAPNGVNYTKTLNQRFFQIGGNRAYSVPLATPSVYHMALDSYGKLWVGSHDAGVSLLTPTSSIPETQTREWKSLKLTPAKDNRNPNFHLTTYPIPSFITYLGIDDRDIVWVGDSRQLRWIDAKSGNIVELSEEWKEIDGKGINSLYFHKDERIIITKENKLFFQQGNNPVVEIKKPISQHIHDWIDISGPLNHKYWLSSSLTGDLFEFDSNTQQIKKLKPITLNGHKIDGINSIWVSPKGILWGGTNGNGIFKYHLRTQDTQWWNTESGLADNFVYTLEGDAHDHIWVAGNKGLSRLNIQTDEIHNFTVKHGLQSNEFNAQASMKTDDGLLFFSGINGITVVNANHFTLNTHIPKTYIQDAFLHTTQGRKRLQVSQKTIEPLSYQENSLTFHIGTIDLVNPLQNTFAYQLSGYNKNWVDLGTNRTISLLNLAPGKYQLLVKSCNSEKTCNPEPATISFTIPAPPWLTIWAFSIYGLILLSILIYFIKKQRDKYLHQRALTEKEHNVANELRELHILKDEFLANTSHELRTPLNGIIGLSEMLSIDTDYNISDDVSESLAAINSCGKQLKKLVDDLLDFSQLQNKRLILERGNFNIRDLVEQIVLLLQPLAEDKKLILDANYALTSEQVYADENRIRQVLYNLINNAIKFSDEGLINVQLTHKGGLTKISVIDQGIGIPFEHQHKIFISFTQLDGSSTRNQGGVGLGLAISKDIIELHGGTLEIESNPGKGSIFSFTLPTIK